MDILYPTPKHAVTSVERSLVVIREGVFEDIKANVMLSNKKILVYTVGGMSDLLKYEIVRFLMMKMSNVNVKH